LVVDIREKVREFKAERMLTKDNVPVTIDTILRYKIIEERARDAILNIEDFNEIIQQVAQTTLRDNIGSSVFQDIYILSKREEVNQHIESVIASEAGSCRPRSDGRRDPAGDNPAGPRSSDVDARAGRQAGREGKERKGHVRRVRSPGCKVV
jgi:regulator of protease activity HflC (stomatin/prohibitin superfamily)